MDDRCSHIVRGQQVRGVECALFEFVNGLLHRGRSATRIEASDADPVLVDLLS